MSAITTMDETRNAARDHIEKAAELLGKIIMEPDMWGASDMKSGYREGYARLIAELLGIKELI